MPNSRPAQSAFIPDQALALVPGGRPASTIGTLQTECCGCPACPCGCQYGVARAKAEAPR